MRRRYLLVLASIVLITVFSIICYLTLLTPLSGYNEPQNQENGTATPSILPFKLPWERTQTTTNKSSGGGAGGGGSGGSGSGGSGSGGSGAGGSISSERTIIIKTYYLLSADSVPEGLKILASYYIDNAMYFQKLDAPFNLEADPNSPVCVLIASETYGSPLRWTVDGQDCEYSVCEVYSYNRTDTVYSDHGCLINMDTNHSLTLYSPA
jgi:hypothetical protein